MDTTPTSPSIFKGAVLTPSRQLENWPAWLRGRAYYRLGLAIESTDEREGEFVFAGYVLYWAYQEAKGESLLALWLASD